MDWPLLQTHRNLLGEQKVQGLLAVLRDSILQHREALSEAIEADDCTEVAQLAHRLAGSCDSLGFRALASALLRSLEEAALGNDQVGDSLSWCPPFIAQVQTFAAYPERPVAELTYIFVTTFYNFDLYVQRDLTWLSNNRRNRRSAVFEAYWR